MIAYANEPLDAVDPDIARIADYMSGALSVAEKESVDKRLDEDADFFAKVWPLMEAWMMPDDEVAVVAAPLTVGPRRRSAWFWTKTGVATAMAAGIAFMAYVGPPVLYPPHPLAGFYQTAANENRDLMLPDRSRVHIGPDAGVLWDAQVSSGRVTVFVVKGSATIGVLAGHHVALWTPGGSAVLQSGEFVALYDAKSNSLNLTSHRGEAVLYDHTANPVRQALKSGESGSATTGNQVHGRVDSPPPATVPDDSESAKSIRPSRTRAVSDFGFPGADL